MTGYVIHFSTARRSLRCHGTISQLRGVLSVAMELFRQEHNRLEQWKTSVVERDELYNALYSKYCADLEKTMEHSSACIMGSILSACKHHGIRYVSVSRGNLITIGAKDIGDVPAAWVIADELGISCFCGNINHHQIRLRGVNDNYFGIYDLEGEPKRIGSPMSFHRTRLHRLSEPVTDIWETLKNATY